MNINIFSAVDIRLSLRSPPLGIKHGRKASTLGYGNRADLQLFGTHFANIKGKVKGKGIENVT